MRGSRGTSAALWVAFAVVALVSGWVAVQMVGGAVTSASVPVLTAGEVSARLATASPAATTRAEPSTSSAPKPSGKPSGKPDDKSSSKPSAGPSGSSSPKPTSSPQPTSTSTPAPDTVVRTLASRGGSVVAACTSGLVRLRSWSPAVGYREGEVDRGPDEEAEIKFVSSSSEVQMKVRCVGGVPSAETEVDDESGDDD